MTDKIKQLIDSREDFLLFGCDRLPEPLLLYPGSFNPLHVGHIRLLRAAEQISGRSGALELSIENVDKPALDAGEIERRLSFVSLPLVLSRAATFIEKAELFPGAWFAMGYDTAIRLIDPKYHPDVPATLRHYEMLGTRFVVAGRLHEKVFQSLEHVEIPSGFEDLFIPIPEAVFREDISSTELRNR